MIPSQRIDLIKDQQTNAAVTAILADAAAEASHEIKIIDLGGQKVLSLPSGRSIQSIENYLNAPYRMKGDRKVNDAESFLSLLRAFFEEKASTEPAPVVKFSLEKLNVRAVINHAAAVRPAWEDHTITWQLRKHRDLLAWEAMTRDWIEQVQFLEFLEDRLTDITDKNGGPAQSVIAGVAANLEVTIDSKFQAKREVHSGSYVLHSDSNKTPTQQVPKRFDIGVRIFDGLDIAYVVPVRLYYTTDDGSLQFKLTFTNLDQVMEGAWNDVTKVILDALPKGVLAINVPE